MLTIRRAGETDVDAMHGIQMRAFEEEGRRCGTREIPPLQERPESILDHVRTQVALVATEGGTTVGCVRGVLAGPVCTVRALVVEPCRHGQGIGSALLRALESGIAGVRRIELTTNTLMEGNVAFYERHGYRVYDRTEPLPGVKLAHLAKEADTAMKITVSTEVAAPIEEVWRAYTTPEDIKSWNAASPDWHTTSAVVDLRPGGRFCSRMEAKDGSFGFDFEGQYTKVVHLELIEYAFGDRAAVVEFLPRPGAVTVKVTFDGETTHSEEQQRTGWQAILDNFSRHVAGKLASQ